MRPQPRTITDLPPMLHPGARVGALSVKRCAEDYLELRARLSFILFWGSAAAGLGLMAGYGWYGLLFTPGWNYSLEGLILYTGVSLLFAWFCLSNLGLRCVVDGRGKTFEKTRFTARFRQTWDVAAFQAVRLEVQGGGTAPDMCRLSFCNDRGEGEPLIAERRTDKRDCVHLILAARHIAAILRLPIEVGGHSKRNCKAFDAALAALRETFAEANPPTPLDESIPPALRAGLGPSDRVSPPARPN